MRQFNYTSNNFGSRNNTNFYYYPSSYLYGCGGFSFHHIKVINNSGMTVESIGWDVPNGIFLDFDPKTITNGSTSSARIAPTAHDTHCGARGAATFNVGTAPNKYVVAVDSPEAEGGTNPYLNHVQPNHNTTTAISSLANGTPKSITGATVDYDTYMGNKRTIITFT